MISALKLPTCSAISGSDGRQDDAATELTSSRQLLWTWLGVRTILWTFVAFGAYPNGPLDLIEWLSWGHAWSWGYPKHPPLPAWVALLFAQLSPGDVWGVYLASYLATAACLWSAWRLGLLYLPPRFALLAALSLDGLLYCTQTAAEFNNNVLLNAGWAVLVVCLHYAAQSGRRRWWLAAGVVAGLTLLCKYTLALLVAPLALYLIVNPATRRHFGTAGPYLAVVVAFLVFAPHLVWMADNDFITLKYAADRSTDDEGWVDHLQNPTMFLLSQAAVLLPVLAVLVPVLNLRPRNPASSGDLRFLHAAVLGPPALLVGLSLLTGCQVRMIWGSPLWTFAGVWVLAVWRAWRGLTYRPTVWRVWTCVAAGLLAVTLVKVYAEPYERGRPSRVHFSGKELAREVGRRWGRHFDRPFAVVAGEPWRAGNVCCYSPHRPVLYSRGDMGCLRMDPASTPWTSDEDLNARGGVIVWNADRQGDTLPPDVAARFPAAQPQPPIVLRYRTGAPLAPARVGLAFVPPATP